MKIFCAFFLWLGGNFFKAPTTALAAEPPASAPAVLTNALQVLRLSREEAAQSVPVRLCGVVTYADAGWQMLFMQDTSAGIYLYRMNTEPVLLAGQQIEAQGVSGPGGFAPVVFVREIVMQGPAPLPETKFFTFDELASGAHDSQWVEVEAIVRAVYPVAGSLIWELGGAHNFQAFMPGSTNAPSQFVDARVRLRGVWASAFNRRGQLTGYQLFSPGLEHLRVVAPARAEPFALPTQSMKMALAFHRAAEFGQRIKVAGVVTAREAGGIFYVQDDTSGLRVHTRDPLALQPGDQLEVAGFPQVDDATPKLVEAVLRRTRTGPPPAPNPIPAGESFTAEWDARLVELEGELIENDTRRGLAKMLLKRNQEFFEARCADTNALRELKRFVPGSRLALAGVGSIQPGNDLRPASLALILRSARDVRILHAAPWWTVPRALGIFGVTTLGLLAWRFVGLRRETQLKEHYRLLFESANDLICTQTLAGEFTRLNAAWARLCGQPLPVLRQMRLAELIVPEQRQVFQNWWSQVATGQSTPPRQFEVATVAGRRVWLEISSQRIDRPQSEPQIESIARDITERKNAEVVLREKDELLRRVIDLVPHYIFAKDQRGRYLFANRSMADGIGISPERLVGLSDLELQRDQKQAEAFQRDDQEVIASAKPKFVPEEFHTDAAGRVRVYQTIKIPFPAPGTGEPALLGVAVDITERKQAEARQAALEMQLRQSQKLEAIGTLAGGIAHDFNNILGAILGNAELLRQELSAQSAAQESIVEILQASLRARDLVKQILSFSRQQPQDRKLIDPGPVILEALKLLRASLPATIEIQTEIQASLPPVLADPTQIHQIILNLGSNAGHAMRASGGRLIVSLAALNLDSAASAPAGNLPAGRYVRVSVADSGHGMDAATQERIFDPFFTTKSPGEGTGLGLAVVHGIMQTHEGAISVESRPGAGATFHLFFPAASGVIAPAEAPNQVLLRGQREHILAVDDEPALVQLAQKVLEKLDYQVTTCTRSRDALAIFRAAPDKFALVLTDLTMPELTGLDLVREIRQLRAATPIILMSGYSGSFNQATAQQLGIIFLGKPFEFELLGQTVRRVLERAAYEA